MSTDNDKTADADFRQEVRLLIDEMREERAERRAELASLRTSQKNVRSGSTRLMTWTALPIVYVWLLLAAVIIYSAVKDQYVLEHVEGLLAALLAVGMPVSVLLTKISEYWTSEMMNVFENIKVKLTGGTKNGEDTPDEAV